MNTKSTAFILLMGLLTTVTLAGSIWLALYFAGPNSINQTGVFPADNFALPAMAMFVSFLCGGGLWGWGIARMTKTDAKIMAKATALSWSIPTFIVVISLGIRLTTITSFGYTLPLRYTYYYLLFFIPVIGIATGINGWVVIGKLGLKELRKKTSLKIGIAAALGFLAVSLFLQFVLGWEVGKPVPGKYEMLTLLHYCNIGAALVGGSVLGRELAMSKNSFVENISPNDS